MPEITLSSLIRRNEDMVTGLVDSELMMMSIDNGKYFRLNATGSRIWQLLEQPQTAGQLCQALSAEFKVTPALCQREVLDFLQALAARKVVHFSATE